LRLPVTRFRQPSWLRERWKRVWRRGEDVLPAGATVFAEPGGAAGREGQAEGVEGGELAGAGGAFEGEVDGAAVGALGLVEGREVFGLGFRLGFGVGFGLVGAVEDGIGDGLGEEFEGGGLVG
jgi:hypothetical protein